MAAPILTEIMQKVLSLVTPSGNATVSLQLIMGQFPFKQKPRKEAVLLYHPSHSSLDDIIWNFGQGDRSRSDGLWFPKPALYQLSYTLFILFK
jgi:hypothetical protein